MVQYAREGGALWAMTTQLGLEARVTLFTQKLPKGAPCVMDQALALTDFGGLMRESLVEVRSLKLRYRFLSFHRPRLDQTGSACLSSVFCLTLDIPGLPYFPT